MLRNRWPAHNHTLLRLATSEKGRKNPEEEECRCMSLSRRRRYCWFGKYWDAEDGSRTEVKDSQALEVALNQLAEFVAIVALHVNNFDAVAVRAGIANHGGEL